MVVTPDDVSRRRITERAKRVGRRRSETGRLVLQDEATAVFVDQAYSSELAAVVGTDCPEPRAVVGVEIVDRDHSELLRIGSRRARGRNRSAGRAEPTSLQNRTANTISSPARNRGRRARRREVVVNLEQLRKQAKELARAARAGDADALARLGGREPILARAQLVLAREHGYTSWAALVTAVEADAETFVLAATSGRCGRAEAMLRARPEIERDPWARLVLGREWAGDPRTPGGARDWVPLLYVCNSCFAS